MKNIERSKPVLVSGASGYLAGWIIRKLLEEGLHVHATVRDLQDEVRLAHLKALASALPGDIAFFRADLLKEGSFDEAMQECELVFHTASPFIYTVKDAQRDLIDPALQGTRNVFGSVDRSPSVKRVVLTSSVAAIVGDAADLTKLPDNTADENSWNHSSSPDHQPYSYSKTVAEKAAWEINRRQDRWDLVVMNPSLVVGPSLNMHPTSESFNLIRQLGDGKMKAGLPDFRIGMVDVRDAALAHYRAGFTPEAEGRHIVSEGTHSFMDLAIMLREAFGDEFPFPRRILPKPVVWLMAPLAGLKRKMISRNVGYPYLLDNTKSIRALQMTYHPVRQAVIDMFAQITAHEQGDKPQVRSVD
ncbi:MAG TPA: aldehyde reductase [Bacteroidales bacterium]|nr:aldehyde reductase [Bacteroidales bacterium]HSA44761.1 aldehyde reductase [Bacteroidales bacterium]